MGVVIVSEVWEPKPLFYLFLCLSCFASIFLLPYLSTNNSSRFDLGNVSSSIPSTFLRFQRRFLLVYSLGSVIEGLGSVLGEFEWVYYGFSREQMVVALSLGCGALLLVGSFLGVISDLIGHKKACILFCILQLFVGFLKTVMEHTSIWMPSVCLALASSLYSFSFESWVVVEHEKQGHRQDLLSDTFWLMTFSESACFIGSQLVANLFVSGNVEKGVLCPSIAASVVAMICIVCIMREWNSTQSTSDISDYRMAFSAHILSDKRIWLLGCAQGCLHFATTIFSILWAPTIVADGREVNLAMIYPCLLGARMLGSTMFLWFLNGHLSIPLEDSLIYAFVCAGLALLTVAYDYQEIGFLVALFCVFHACVGLILPSLARLRTKFLPNELRAGMISLSLAPANAAVLLVLIQGGYYRNLANSTIMVLSVLGLLIAAGCVHALRRSGKQPYQSWHKL